MMILLPAARIRIPRRMCFSCCGSFWPILFVSILRRSWGSSTWADQNVTLPFVKQLFTICNLWLPESFASGVCSKDIGELRSSKSVACPWKTLLLPILLEQISKKPLPVISKVPRFRGKAPFSHLGLGPVLALTSEDLSWFWILRSSVMLNFSIASRFSENPFYCISFSCF